MAVSTTTNRLAFAGNSATTLFAFPEFLNAATDVVALLVTNATGAVATQVLNTDFTLAFIGSAVNGVYPGGANITMLVAPPTGTTLVLYRDVPATQSTHWTDNDPMPAGTTETTHDRAFTVLQRIKDIATRAFRLSDGFYATFSTALPVLMPANSSIVINPAGDGLAMGPTVDTISGAVAAAAAAASSASGAAASQAAAATSATAAASSATAAAASATSSGTSASSAATSATAAASSATAAAASATTASTQATNAATSATAAASSATTASTQATNAATSATAAASSATAAAASAASAAAASGYNVTGTFAAPTLIAAAGAVAFTAGILRSKLYVAGNGAARTVGSFQAGTIDGQEMMVVGCSDTNTITIDSPTRGITKGTLTLGANDIAIFNWDAGSAKWVEVSRNN